MPDAVEARGGFARAADAGWSHGWSWRVGVGVGALVSCGRAQRTGAADEWAHAASRASLSPRQRARSWRAAACHRHPVRHGVSQTGVWTAEMGSVAVVAGDGDGLGGRKEALGSGSRLLPMMPGSQSFELPLTVAFGCEGRRPTPAPHFTPQPSQFGSLISRGPLAPGSTALSALGDSAHPSTRQLFAGGAATRARIATSSARPSPASCSGSAPRLSLVEAVEESYCEQQ